MISDQLKKALGPGILFAGAAIGVSHLVQSTRAGAGFGLGLVGVVLLANIVKYPGFAFGPHYASATGTSLLEGYRRRGTWTLVLYSLLTLATMFTVQAAVTLTTAGLAAVTFGVKASPLVLSGVLTALCVVLLTVGKFPLLDKLIKVVVAILTIATVLATVIALKRVDFSSARLLPDTAAMSKAQLLFLAALVGWMPSAVDVSIWQSCWTLARAQESGHRPTVRESRFDFNVGYLGTAALAFCFIMLGAAVFYGSGTKMQPSAGAFAHQVVSLYSDNLGEWTRPLIGTCALLVMFSTTLTVIDGFPRALSTLSRRFRGPEPPNRNEGAGPAYWVAMGVLAIGSLLVVQYLLTSFKLLIDIATTASFLTAPVLSWLNHRAVFSADLKAEDRPGDGMWWFSAVSILIQGTFALWYLQFRFF